IQILQQSDFREANIPCYYCSTYWRDMWSLVEPHKDWLLSNVLRAKSSEGWDQPSDWRKEDLIRAWLQALAEHRSVWCWNRSVNESFALWKIYAERGVAIYSNVGRLQSALENSGVRSGIVSPVTYIGDLGEEGEPQQRHDRLENSLTCARNLHRPY